MESGHGFRENLEEVVVRLYGRMLEQRSLVVAR
jgi:hypothetical protein